MSIRGDLVGKTAREKANLKGQEIARVFRKGSHIRGALRIDVVDIEPIEGGVQVFARVWRNGQQLGFGKDGTVDIERFRIFNPPVLVDDPNGDITVEIPEETVEDGTTIPAYTRVLREDPQEASIVSLVHTLSVMKNVHDGTKIVQGKRGNTTSTFYSAAGDGAITSGNLNTFSNVRDTGVSLAAAYVETTRNVYTDRTTSGTRFFIRRLYFPFDTSAISDSDTISSATASFYSTTGSNNGLSASLGLIRGAQASRTSLATTDWPPVDFTRIATDKTIASIISGGSAYYDFALNSTGIAHISMTGDTDIVMSTHYDIDNSAPGSDANSYMTFFMSEQSGTTNDPKLVVEHAAGGTDYPMTASVGSFTLIGVATALKRDYRMTATVASFTLNGLTTGFTKALKQTADTASFALQGVDIGFLEGVSMPTTLGTFTLTGNAANLTRSCVLSAETATLSLAGVSVTLDYNDSISIAADPGAFTLTGVDANLTVSIRLTAETATFDLVGIEATFNFPDVYTLIADTVEFTLTGIPPSFQLDDFEDPDWINESVPGGTWQAGEPLICAGSTLHDGLTVYAGQLGVVSQWDLEEEPAPEDVESPYWVYDSYPGGTWQAGQPTLTAGALLFDGLTVYAGQLGEASTWETEVQ